MSTLAWCSKETRCVSPVPPKSTKFSTAAISSFIVSTAVTAPIVSYAGGGGGGGGGDGSGVPGGVPDDSAGDGGLASIGGTPVLRQMLADIRKQCKSLESRLQEQKAREQQVATHRTPACYTVHNPGCLYY